MFGLLGAGIIYAQTAGSWTPPTDIPPAGNVPAPVNIGNNQQWKLGQLNVNTNTDGTTGTYATGFTTWGKSIFNGQVDIAADTVTPNSMRLVNNGKSQFKDTAYFDGQIQIKGGSPGVGKVLTSTDTNGLASWVTPAGTTPLKLSAFSYSTRTRGDPNTLWSYSSYNEWILIDGAQWTIDPVLTDSRISITASATARTFTMTGLTPQPCKTALFRDGSQVFIFGASSNLDYLSASSGTYIDTMNHNGNPVTYSVRVKGQCSLQEKSAFAPFTADAEGFATMSAIEIP